MRAHKGTSWVFSSFVVTFQTLSNKDRLQYVTSIHFYYDKRFIKKKMPYLSFINIGWILY